MKRRNGQAEGKRRPVKRTKLTDNIFGRYNSKYNPILQLLGFACT